MPSALSGDGRPLAVTRIHRIWRSQLRNLLATVLLAGTCLTAAAAEHRFDLLLDTDNNAATGCSVSEPAGSVGGVEQVTRIYVDTTTTAATVNRITQASCVQGTLGTETIVDSSGWPVGLGNGTAGLAVIEAYVTRSLLPTTGTMRVVVASNSDGAGDLAPAFTLALGDPPQPPALANAIPVPLARWLAGALALALSLGTLWWHRRHPHHSALFMLVLLCSVSTLAWAATVVLDGNVADWMGVQASATDPRGDAPVDTDIVAVFAQRDVAKIYFRIDADVQLDAVTPGNAAPVVAAGADQTITLPAIATLAGTASDDGLPNPPAHLTLLWTAPVAPAAVAFANSAAAQTTATFAQAGTYTLRLSASDGALSTSSDVHVVVLPAASVGPTFLPIADRTIPVGVHYQQVLAANSDAPGTLSYSLPTAPAGAALSPSPLVDWTPGAGQLGVNTFTAMVTDAASRTATTTFHVNVVFIDHPPKLAPQPDATLPAGDTFTRTLTATDPDAGDTLVFTLVTGPPGMTLVGSALGWETSGVAPGTYVVTVKVTDASGQFDTRTFHIVVTATAPPPVANDDHYSVRLGETLAVPAPGVLTNDVDPAGGSLLAQKLTDPDKGTLNAFNADGSFNYTAPSVPAGAPFLPVLKWSNGQQADGDATPVVADVFANGKPVVFASRAGINQGGVTAIDGTTGTTLWTVAGELPAPYAGCYIPQDNLPQNQTADDVAVGDIDDSGIPALVTIAYCNSDNAQGTRMIALNARTGAVKWLTPPLGALIPGSGGVYFHMTYGVTPAIARLRAGETPSVLFKVEVDDYLDSAQTVRKCDQFQANSGLYSCTGVLVLDGADGSVRQRMIAPNDNFGRDNRGSGHLMVAALSGTGPPNIIANGAVWDVDGNLLSNRLGTAARSIALAKLDDSGQLSIISYEVGASYSAFIVARHGDGTVLWKTPIDATAVHGLLSVADLDGDGSPDIMASAEGNLYVYDAHGQVKWVHRYANASNLRTIDTGKRPAAFDLDGDGIAEVIVPTVSGLEFNDGKTGKTKAIVPWPDLGVTNEPAFDNGRVVNAIVADIDGSGHASIVLVFPSHYYGATQYVVAIKSANDDWRPAPTVFNQFSYHVANVDNIGHIPLVEANNFAVPRTNVFGTQAQTQDPIDPRAFQATSFTYAAANNTLSSQPATVAIDIQPQNSPPVFTSIAPTAYVPYALTYAAHATDPDPGDTITYSLALGGGSGGPYCTVEGSSGLVSCVSLDSGDQYFTVVATDSQGAAAYQSVHVVQSAGPATVPNVVGQLQAAASATLAGAGFGTGTVTPVFYAAPVGQVISQSPSGGTSALLGQLVNLSVSQGPMPVAVPFVVGESLSLATSQLAGLGFTETVSLTPSATTPLGQVLTQSPLAGTILSPNPANPVALTVSSGSSPDLANLKRIDVKPGTAARIVGETVPFTATAIYNSGKSVDFTLIATWASSAIGVATVDVVGNAKAVSAGSTTISATIAGFTGQATLTAAARMPGDITSPVAQITTPADGATVTTITQIVGTATDANFLRYELAIAPAGDTTWIVIGEGTAPVTAGTLGTFDPTALVNDLYTLRLTVYDRNDNQTVATATVQVAGGQKPGVFALTYQDLNLPTAGIPVSITRAYDSRDKSTGDFGIGWRLGVKTLRLRTNRVPGTGWQRAISGPSVILNPLSEHKVSLTLPDGKVEEFDLVVSPTSGIGGLDETTVTGYAPRTGTLGKLEMLDNPNLLILSGSEGDELVDDTTLNTFDPVHYRYTTVTGTSIEINHLLGVTKITDLNGNSITFSPGGIIHSSGKSVTFTRDTQGRITQVTDPLGNVQAYSYDGNGDLISHMTATGLTSRYAYDSQHNLIDIQDPAGNHPARNNYDGAGHLISTTDANGNTITLANDQATSRQVLTDQMGNPTVYDYDAMGNVIAKTDALGHVSAYTFDSRNNPLTEIDPLGRVANKTYDANNNVLTSTDFDGNTTTSSYNAFGQVLTQIDAEGHKTTNVYDGSGNLTQITDPEGGVTAHTYDAIGNALTTTDPLGHVTTSTYDGSGNKASQTDPLGHTTTYSYDANGQNLTEVDQAGKVATRSYDAARRMSSTTDKMGNVTLISYSNAGSGQKIASRTGSSGDVTRLDYDPAGNLTTTTFPDGSVESMTYDAENHVLSKTDRDGHAVSYLHDALGRTTRVTNPDGSTTNRTFDVAGRVLTQTNERGSTTTYAYASNLQTVTNALGHATAHLLSSKGRRLKTTDALGHVTSFSFDSYGNPTKTTFADGSSKLSAYDAALRKTTETDQAGRATQFAYDDTGTLLTVTDAAGGVTSYTYDSVGNRLTQADANGHITRMTYDSLGRMLTRTIPSGKQENFLYDSRGNEVSHTDFLGQATTFAYDAVNRLIQKNLPDHVVTYSYTGTGSRTQAGNDNYLYDSRDLLVREIKASGENLVYTYDAAGNKTSVTSPQSMTTYAYDTLDRLAGVTDAAGTTVYGYDAVGNLSSTTYPNGVATTYAYDALNRLLNVSNSGPAGLISSYVYTLGPAGNRMEVVEAGPGTTSRVVTYAFDPVYRLIQEHVSQPATPDMTVGFSYDAVGNRVQMNRNGALTAYTFDTRDRLITEAGGAGTFTSSYDDNGNLASRSGVSTTSYVYDTENRLRSAATSSGIVSYNYDTDGMRVSKTAGGITTTYLVDKLSGEGQVLVEKVGATAATYTFGHQLISQSRPDEGVHIYLADGQLSTRQLTDMNGSVSDRYTYEAYGTQSLGMGNTTNEFRYAGEQFDPNVSFYYLRARYYSPDTGRFVSTDPIEGDIFEPVSLHRYLYANTNPVDMRDPSGKDTLPEILAASAISGGIGATAAVAGLVVKAGLGGTVTLADAGRAILAGFVIGASGGALAAGGFLTEGLFAVAALNTSNTLFFIHKSHDVSLQDLLITGGLSLVSQGIGLGAGQVFGGVTARVNGFVGTGSFGGSFGKFVDAGPKDNVVVWRHQDRCPTDKWYEKNGNGAYKVLDTPFTANESYVACNLLGPIVDFYAYEVPLQ